jgi:predicted transcriptional regulator
MSTTDNSLDLLTLTTEIVAAHVSNNNVNPSDLPALISSVHNALVSVGSGRSVAAERPQPAVSIKKSITDDYIICLEDGKKLKMLKRHLMSHYNLTPEQYRERWALPADYPMTAPNYAAARSRLAKKIGLGSKPRTGKAAKGRKAA